MSHSIAGEVTKYEFVFPHIPCFDFELAFFLVESPDVVLWVQGRATTPDHRVNLRELVGSPARWPKGVKTLLLFFVGYSKDDATQQLLEYESECYNDIVQNEYLGMFESSHKLLYIIIRSDQVSAAAVTAYVIGSSNPNCSLLYPPTNTHNNMIVTHIVCMLSHVMLWPSYRCI